MIGTTINVGKLMTRVLVNNQLDVPFGVIRFPKPPRFSVSQESGGYVCIRFDQGCEPELFIDGPGWLDMTVAVCGLKLGHSGRWIELELDGLPDPRINLEW